MRFKHRKRSKRKLTKQQKTLRKKWGKNLYVEYATTALKTAQQLLRVAERID